MADEGRHVDRGALLAKTPEVAPERAPVPGERREDDPGGVDRVLTAGIRQRRRTGAAVADHLEGESLADLAVRRREPGQDVVGVGVHVDETRRHHQPGRVDDPRGRGVRQVPDLADPVALDRDVGPACRASGSVDDRTAPHEHVQHDRSSSG
jgi:hypothetical protein